MTTDTSSPHHPRTTLVNWLLVMVSIAVAFTGLELLFRFTVIEERLFPRVVVSDNAFHVIRLSDDFPLTSTMILNHASSTVTYTYPDDPRGYFGDRNTVESRINSLGFRGPEFQREKGNGVFRVAFLGDSFTLGNGVKFEDTYPQCVSAELNRRYDGSGVRFESYNFSVGGGNLVNTLNVFVTSVVGSSPDMVILGLTLNDVEPNIFVPEIIGGRLVSVRVPRALDWFEGARIPIGQKTERGLASYRVLSRAWTSMQTSARTVEYYRALYGQGNSEWLEINLQALESIVERCSRRRIPFRILILPVFYRL
ncbi:MAG: SGNH/GDSL hydrolase family protein, partial [Candidatus Dadabacteria bacterium]|nr:SGNH/GDSL hydrolase family protein [Candidatus Dadabacteria bacterium]